MTMVTPFGVDAFMTATTFFVFTLIDINTRSVIFVQHVTIRATTYFLFCRMTEMGTTTVVDGARV
jgi:hypothetical protein